MLQLSDDMEFFIDTLFPGKKRDTVLKVFEILDSFGVKDLENPFQELIGLGRDQDPVGLDQVFLNNLTELLETLVDLHGIKLMPEGSVRLEELMDICDLLLVIPKLEDKSFIRYRVNSMDSSRMVFLSFLERYKSFSMLRGMETIGSVSVGLIEAIRGLCGNYCADTEVSLDLEHLEYIRKFFSFIENTPCVGLELKEQGYAGKVDLTELLDLLPYNLSVELDKQMVVNPAQVGLDVLSILIITKGDYKDPVNKFKQNSSIFTNNLIHVTRLSSILVNLMNDFGSCLDAIKNKKVHYANDN